MIVEGKGGDENAEGGSVHDEKQRAKNGAALWGKMCATQVLPIRVGPFAFRYQGNGATPCQYIDTSRKAIDCATTLPLAVFI